MCLTQSLYNRVYIYLSLYKRVLNQPIAIYSFMKSLSQYKNKLQIK